MPTRGPQAPLSSPRPKAPGGIPAASPASPACRSPRHWSLTGSHGVAESQTRLKRLSPPVHYSWKPPAHLPASLSGTLLEHTSFLLTDLSKSSLPTSLPPTLLSEVHQTPMLFRGKVFLILKNGMWILCVCVCVCVCVCARAQSCPTLCDPMDCSLYMRFSRQEYWTKLPFSTPRGIFPTQGLNPCLLHLLHLQTDSLSLCYLGSPCLWIL